MIPAYAMSWVAFVDTMRRNSLDDSNINKKDKCALIEIMGEQDLGSMPYWFKQDHPNVLRLLFDDVETDLNIYSIGHPDDDEREYFKVLTLSKEQAKQIVDFVDSNKEVDMFIIHCAAGVSRSGSVAKFIMEYTDKGGEKPDTEFYRLNSHCSPKAGFMKTLRDAAQQK